MNELFGDGHVVGGRLQGMGLYGPGAGRFIGTTHNSRRLKWVQHTHPTIFIDSSQTTEVWLYSQLTAEKHTMKKKSSSPSSSRFYHFDRIVGLRLRRRVE
jgi:hypothetical protein